jgi:esterase/lipase superfamily enzyme
MHHVFLGVRGIVKRAWRWIAAVCCALALSACASQATRELLPDKPISISDSEIAGRHEIFVATTRAPSEVPLEVFSGDRSTATSFVKVDITVPKDHKTGEIERRKKGQAPDPSKYYVAESVTGYSSPDAFSKALRTNFAKDNGRALVFIHGYNTYFDGAVYRMTQIVHDAGYQGTPILFTWASAGKTVDYVYDNNSASAARDSLEATLRLIAKSGAKRIDIIAHSMGNWVTMEALRQLAISGDRDLSNRLGDVVLASPDIDFDVFRTQMVRYGKPDKPFILFLSRDDRALRISSLIAGKRQRVGDYKDAQQIADLGVIAVDVSDVKAGDRLNHAKFADNPLLIKILGERLKRSDNLATTEQEVGERVGGVASDLGVSLTDAAQVIITTPLNVMRIAVGQ